MMRTLYVIMVLCTLGCASPPDVAEHQLAQTEVPGTTVQRPDDPGSAYAALLASPTSGAAQRDWFKAFPADHPELRQLFGFEEVTPDSVVFGPYYEQGDPMITAFFNLDSVPVEQVAGKAIGIAMNGVWQEDGVGLFQFHLTRHFATWTGTYLRLLDALPAAEQAGFWRFYTDGPEAYPADDKAQLRSQLSKNARQLVVVDSVLKLPRPEH